MLQIRDGLSSEFEAAFARAQEIIASAPGCLGHELRRCLEVPGSRLQGGLVRHRR